MLRIVEGAMNTRNIPCYFKFHIHKSDPKEGNPSTFDDFIPISFCNCIYKIIQKLIVAKVEKKLSIWVL